MIEPAMLAELQAAGVALSPDTDEAAILKEMRALILDVVTADPKAFDRKLYDRLMHVGTTLDAEANPA
jgi:hypothetical protein